AAPAAVGLDDVGAAVAVEVAGQELLLVRAGVVDVGGRVAAAPAAEQGAGAGRDAVPAAVDLHHVGAVVEVDVAGEEPHLGVAVVDRRGLVVADPAAATVGEAD